MSSRELSDDRPHREQAVPATATRDAYLQWRQRIADRQATRRQPDEAPPPAPPTSRWDPEALFRADEATTVPAEEEADRARAIDLRDRGEAPLTPPLLDPPPSPSPRPAGGLRRDPRKERRDSVVARLEPPVHAPRRPTTGPGAVEPPPRKPAPASIDLTPIGDALRELNEQRLDGTVTDEEFNRRKAEIFERAPRR